MENKKYIEPEIEITDFIAQDIITTSVHDKEDEGIVLPDEEW